MLRKLLILSLLSINFFSKCDIEIRRDQPRINIRVFKSDDINENLNEFPISNDVKIDFKEIIEYFADQKKYNDANISIPKIILLNGDPNNGDKWELSRVIAKEMNFSVIRIFPFEIIEGNIQFQYLLKQLTEIGPCIVFIDNFEEFLKKPVFNSKFFFQLKASMEILKQFPIIIICAINNPYEIKMRQMISESVFLKEILIPYPDLHSREQILNVFAKNIKLNTLVEFKKIAMLTYGFTVSNLFELINDTKAISIKKGKEQVHYDDFDQSISKLRYGKNRQHLIKEDNRKITAYHEAGHALIKVLLLRELNPLYKVTIVSRDAYLGLTCNFYEEKNMYSKDEIYNLIQIALAGTISERIMFNNVYTGAESDLKSATGLATHMVCNYGMSDNLVPMIYNESDKIIKQEIQSMIKKAYDNVYRLLSDNKDKLKKIADTLLEKETIYASEIYSLLGLEPKS